MKEKLALFIFGIGCMTAIGKTAPYDEATVQPTYRDEEWVWSEEQLSHAEAGEPETIVSGDMAWDQVALRMEVEKGDIVSEISGYELDYQAGGDWYTVYRGGGLHTAVWDRPREALLRLPAGTFILEGEYRLRIMNWGSEEVGSCQFTVNEPTRPVKSAKPNDFDYWELADERDRVNEDISMTFSALKDREPEWPEEYVAALEYELVNQKDSYSCCPDCWRIDYLCGGEWYKVASNRYCNLLGMQEQTVPGLTYVKQWPLECKEVLEHPGAYRLYRDGMGYFEFQVE